MNNTIYELNQGMPQSLQYSTNFVWQSKFITKPGKPPIHPQTGRYFNPSKEWINITSDVDRLFEIIFNGHPVCCQLGTKEDNAYHIHIDGDKITKAPHGYRDAKHFIKTNVAFVDLDKSPVEGEELSIEQSLSHPFFQHYGTGYYTSPSYTPELQKHRLVFVLERIIDNEKQYHQLLIGLIKLFNSDAACKDGARLFFGAVGCQYEIFNRFIPNTTIDELIESGRKIEKRNDIAARKHYESVKFTRFGGIEDGIYLEWDKPLYLSNGEMVYLDQITQKIAGVFCPWHETDLEGKGTEFVGVSRAGTPFFVCQKCSADGKLPTSVWPRPKTKDQDLNKLLEKIIAPTTIIDFNNDEEFKYPEETLKAATVIETNEKYLPSIPYKNGLTFVKSGKGSNKTGRVGEDIINRAKGIQKDSGDDFDIVLTSKKKAKTESVLLIGQ